MSLKLKPLSEQVIVITGASSGIGLATAETAARKGASVVLAARSAQTLDSVILPRITAAGGQAVAVECDVADRAQVHLLAHRREVIAAGAQSVQDDHADLWPRTGLDLDGRGVHAVMVRRAPSAATIAPRKSQSRTETPA